MSDQGFGQLDPTDSACEFNVRDSHIRKALAGVRTKIPVQVVAVYDAGMNAITAENTGVIGPIGFVDVQPLVNQIDGAGNSEPHVPIYGLPFQRLQGGANAVICDPMIGDKGTAAFCDRDISAVKATGAQANPGSFRRFSFSDGIYEPAILNGVPTQYVRFMSNGMQFVDKNGNVIVMTPDGVTLTDNFSNKIAMASGGVTINGILFPTSGIEFNVKTHTHHQPNDSHNDVEQPTNAPDSGS
jgi:hypothetical protein